MRVVAIIQARMASTRLPGKVLMDIGGRTMLERVILRTRLASLVDEVAVATTTAAGDDRLAAACVALDAPAMRGSEDDVLDRYRHAAALYGADAIVRITSDCPLIDPSLIDDVVASFLAESPDYASNIVQRSYPRGLDTEVISRAALERAWREAAGAQHRAHVTPYVYLHPTEFTVVSVCGRDDFSDNRWTVDTQIDLDVVRDIYAAARNRDDLGWTEALAMVQAHPDILTRNRDVRHKALEEG
ncbi:cytidylyltransferase domain-containing protein [Acidobacteriota bacterium]